MSLREDALLLRRLRIPENIIAHSLAVRKIALAIARRIGRRGRKVDAGLVGRGALFHDVGRGRTHGLRHGYEGGRILRRAGVDERVARIAERHLLGGLAADEARKLGIPARNYLPESIEEKIVCYADKFSDQQKLGRIADYLGKRSAGYGRIRRIIAEVERAAGGKIKMVQDFGVTIVLKKGGRYFVVKRKSPPIWEFPGGAIEWGESPEEAVGRECAEECGLNVKVGKALGTTSAVFEKEGKLKHAVYFVFEGKVAGGAEPKLGGEHSSYRWVSLGELKRMRLGYNAAPIVGFLKG